MNIHCFQHVPFEGLGCIENWIQENGHNLTYTKFFEDDSLPDLNEIDFLIVLGGPMGIFDYEEYKWLAAEKEFIKKAIEDQKIILGICLGAQLIANVLGAKVFPNKEKEIGWLPVRFSTSFNNYAAIKINTDLKVFHWHGDTFDIPAGAKLHSSSVACANQIFSHRERVLGIQFHLESTPKTVQLILENCRKELQEGGLFVQNEQEILQEKAFFKASNKVMYEILETLTEIK